MILPSIWLSSGVPTTFFHNYAVAVGVVGSCQWKRAIRWKSNRRPCLQLCLGRQERNEECLKGQGELLFLWLLSPMDTKPLRCPVQWVSEWVNECNSRIQTTSKPTKKSAKFGPIFPALGFCLFWNIFSGSMFIIAILTQLSPNISWCY